MKFLTVGQQAFLGLSLCGVTGVFAAVNPPSSAASAALAVSAPHKPAAQTSAKAPAKAPTKAAGKTAEKAPDFTLAPPPAWVHPLKAEDPTGLPNAAVQVLLREDQIRVDGDSASHYQHAVRQINATAGLQQGAQIELEFDPAYQKLVFHELAIWRDGQRIDKLDRKLIKVLHREPQLERQVIDGRMTASIVLDDLRVGDRVEWAASVVGINPVFGGKFVDDEWTSSSLGPVGLLQVRLLAPEARVLHHREPKGLVEVQEQVAEGWRETLFTRRKVPQFHFDPLTPVADYVADHVEISEFADWAEVASWADQLFAKSKVGLDALDPELDSIRAQSSDPEQQLRLVLDFVQQQIRYFGSEIGIDSHQPAAADVVLRQRFGDCKDKAALLVNMLGKLGIQATPVLVSTQMRERVGERLPSPLDFDHAIATVQLGDKTLWLDATRDQQRGKPEARMSYGLGDGLLAHAGTAALTAMPSASEALRTETTETYSFPKLSEEGQVTSVITYHGDLAEWIRSARATEPAEDFKKTLIDETLRVHASFAVEGDPQVDEVEGDNAVKVTLHYRTGDYWRFPEHKILAGEFAVLGLIGPLRLRDQTPRTQATLIGMPGHYVQKTRYEFGDVIRGGAEDNRHFEDKNNFFDLQLRYQSTAQAEEIDGDLHLKALSIPAGQWTRYRDALNKDFPRLANGFGVPTMSPDQGVALQKTNVDLMESIRRGTVKVRTQDQVMARMRLALADAQLSAGRLTPKLRAQVLLDRGAQLTILGNSILGLEAFNQALQLDADSSDAHAALAANALTRHEDGEAIEQAQLALQLAPNDIKPRYTAAWADYFKGDLTASRDELHEILQTSAEVERSYGAIWLDLVAHRQGEDGTVATKDWLPQGEKPAWPYPVLQLLRGQLDFDAALKATRDNDKPVPGRECELYFFAGEKALLDKDLATARKYLRKSVDTGVVEFIEYNMAQRELDRLDGR